MRFCGGKRLKDSLHLLLFDLSYEIGIILSIEPPLSREVREGNEDEVCARLQGSVLARDVSVDFTINDISTAGI